MKTEQERIDYLADRIRSFKIVVSGDGHVEGGFGRIPNDGVTIDHLEKSFSKFRLQAAFTKYENPVDGFPTPVNPPPPPPSGCPETLTVTFSGVTACPCIDMGSGSILWDEFALDIEASLEKVNEFDGNCFWADSDYNGSARITSYDGCGDCSCTIEGQATQEIHNLGVVFYSGAWYVLWDTPVGWLFFYGGGSADMSDPVTNQCACDGFAGFSASDPYWVDIVQYAGVNSPTSISGTAMITTP